VRIEEDVRRCAEEYPDLFKTYDRDELLARCARKEGRDWETRGEEERQRLTDKLLDRR
jgi:hypothetical protein